MSDKIGHFDEDLYSRVGPNLAEDLNVLFGPGSSVPAEVDRAVIDRANRHFVRRGRRRPWPRWAASAAAATDIDRNGCVDILDAFKLARHIESAEVREAKWDINGDGLVDRADVDVVAFAAVRLDEEV